MSEHCSHCDTTSSSLLEKLETPKWLFSRLGAAVVLTAAAKLIPMPEAASSIIYIAAYIIAGLPVIVDAFHGLFVERDMNENLLMTVATVGALALGEFVEALAVMVLFGIGEYLSDLAVDRSERSIVKLLDTRPDSVTVLKDGVETVIAAEDAAVNDIIILKAGERAALDGIVVSGASFADTSSLTGESLPASIDVGSELLSGYINLSGRIEYKVTAPFSESTTAGIIELVENSSEAKSKSEKFITRFSRVFTPAAIGTALLLAIVPPLLGLGTFPEFIYRALNLLIISCPCAIVISVPLAYFLGIGAAAKNGVVVKGGNYLEALNKVCTVALDKTGTLTEGRFTVTAIKPSEGVPEQELLHLTSMAELGSNHPLALAIAEYAGPVDSACVLSAQVISGLGVKAVTTSGTVIAGNARLLSENGVRFVPETAAASAVYTALDGKYMGCILLSDKPKANSALAVKRLHGLGVDRIVMLTGDNGMNAAVTARALGITEVRGGLLPAQKTEAVSELTAARPADKRVLFVGDGLNDAPALACADIGIAMGALGSKAAVEAADAVLMHDDLLSVCDVIDTAKRTHRIAVQNVILALGLKAIILGLSLFGNMHVWLAVIADVGASLLAVANSLRLMKKK